MSKPVVSIVKYEDPVSSLRESLELCGGLKDFKTSDKVLIKPNLVAWDFGLPFPPYGMVTTSAVVHALVHILADEGIENICIGEASLPVPVSQGREIFKRLGYEKLKERYGVELVDFNTGEFEKVEFDGFSLMIAQRALEADKIVNVPVLKTHNQCKVSLGLKNLKGCLHRASKMFCHHKEKDLNSIFPQIIEKLPAALTVIDGVYALERGPAMTGMAYRKNLLIASTDTYACDVVGAGLLGYEAGEVEHLKYYAQRNKRSTSMSDIELIGERFEDHKDRLEYDWEWTTENTGPLGFEKRGISGIAVRKYDNTLCTGCTMYFNPMLIMLISAFKGKAFPGIELVSGKKQLASSGFKYTVLFGRCAVNTNKGNLNIQNAIPLKGCPPDLNELQERLQEIGVSCDYNEYIKYRHYLFKRYENKEDFDLSLFSI